VLLVKHILLSEKMRDLGEVMASRWARFVRGWLTAAVAVFVAAFSHMAAGDTAPGAVGMSLALAFSGMVCVALAGKTLSVLRLSLSVGFSQIVFHLLFGLGGSSGASMQLAGSSHHGAGSVTLGSVASVGSMDMTSSGATNVGGWMWAAHGIAAVVTIVALRRGEKTFWALRDIAASGLTTVLRGCNDLTPVVLGAVKVAAAPVGWFVPANFSVLHSSLTRRGPPTIRPAH
jgi:hypothetical protein